MEINLKQAAIAYAVRGWPVFPLQARTKRPSTRKGLHAATTNPKQVAQWWTRWPDANIGLTTGVVFDVIDADGARGLNSVGSLCDLEDNGIQIVGLAATAHGYHYFTPATGAGNTTNMAPAVDYRGVGGYIVAPPSLIDCDKDPCPNPQGDHRYRWVLDEMGRSRDG